MLRLRQALYRLACRARGLRFLEWRDRYLRELREGLVPGRQEGGLAAMLRWSRDHVPLHRAALRGIDDDAIAGDPVAVLRSLPILTKDVIRARRDDLLSDDLSSRRWYENTSGGSTGEPVRLVQDREYFDRSMGSTLVFSTLAGRRVGEPELRIWGSERDILEGGQGLRRRVGDWLTGSRTLNAFRMSPETMASHLDDLDRRPPRLVLAYAQAAYELARFAESTGRTIRPPGAVMTSAGTLHPFMRETIARVFGCPVYNRYGSREVGDVACELPGHEGLWVSPWNAFVEILDASGEPAREGEEGDIVVTSLTNFAMPLLRYAVGDRGALGPPDRGSQSLRRVSGRNVDTFVAPDGTLVDGEYFTHLLYFRDWVRRFQVVQVARDRIVIRVVPAGPLPPGDLEAVTAACRAVMGPACDVSFETVQALPEGASGKYRYTVSEVRR